MKISWGVKITIVYGLFVLFIVTLVIIFMNQKVDLVDDDYYPKEIVYQQQINKIQRTQKLPEHVSIDTKLKGIEIKFPASYNPADISGKINFYRPSDKTKDFTINLSLNQNCQQLIPSDNLEKGLWKVKIEWNHLGTSYYNESTIMVN
ncbi:FixH family protein [Melioribacteraceae bacterium 4301-Me]|uniref:FixH family protein n=1 Tax=Pyranulibacter aquaticus TaxID=3163344 RepID=UPI003594BC17